METTLLVIVDGQPNQNRLKIEERESPVSKQNKKNKGKRSRCKYPGLNPAVNRVNIRDLLDFDYIDQLSDKEKEFLSKFVTEYYTAGFHHDKTQYKNKQPLHKGKKARRKIYKSNNSRNSDITAYLGNYHQMLSVEQLSSTDETFRKMQSPEDSLNRMIDIKRKAKK